MSTKLDTKQESKSEGEKELIEEAICPACPGEAVSNSMFKMHNSDTDQMSRWHECVCGCVWQADPVVQDFGSTYIKKLLEDKEKYAESSTYPCRLYAPIIEELTYGRKMLDVGYTSPYNMLAFRKRGWVSYGIENCPEAETTPRLIKGDFETHSFPFKFDLLWLSNVMENLRHPLLTLEKAYDILQESGVLYISTPDTDFIRHNSPAGFSHWDRANNLMFSSRSLKFHLEKLGFNVVLQRKNYEKRFTAWDTQHVIAQKRFF